MASYLRKLSDQGLIMPPKWLPNNVMFEGMTGSVSYGCSTDSSDMDIVGFCIPPKELVFPHTAGIIQGFGTQIQRFDQYVQHHVKSQDGKKEFDFTCYSIVKWFQLTMENNPNMIDVLFLPRRCVLHSTEMYEYIREHRREFLHKGSWPKFKGYAYSQLNKIRNKTNSKNPKRLASIQKFGYDVKFAYHVVRLLLEVEQIMVEHDLDIERHREMYKSVRRGDWSLEDLEKWAADKEADLEKVYHESSLRYKPDEALIKTHLIHCLEGHYGSMDNLLAVQRSDSALKSEIEAVLEKY